MKRNTGEIRFSAALLAAAAMAGATQSCRTGADSGELSFAPADYVNPFIGASTNIDDAGAYHGLGKTFPGATTLHPATSPLLPFRLRLRPARHLR